MSGVAAYVTVGVGVIASGLAGVLIWRHLLILLMSIEIMLNSVNLTLVAFNRWNPGEPGAWSHQGQVFAFFVIAVAAAEAAVGLAILISLFRLRKSVESDRADLLKH